MIAVIDLIVFNPVTMKEEAVRLTSGSHFIEGENQYLPFISELPSYNESIFTSGAADGEISSASGSFKIANTDGSFDYLESYGISGRQVTIRVAEDEESPAVLQYKGIVTFPTFEFQEITINLSNALEDLNVAAITKSFEGTNVGPVGLEGSEQEGKGNLKPFVYGRVFNVPATQVNSSLLVYALNYDKDGNRAPVHKIWAVRVKGGALKHYQEYADLQDFLEADIPNGQYATCLNEGLIRLGVVPVGQVCVDLDETTLDACTAGQVLRRILTERASKLDGADFDGGSLLSLDSFNSCPVGVYVADSSTILNICSQVLNSIGSWMACNSLGMYYFGTFDLSKFSVPTEIVITEDFISRSTLAKLPTGVNDRNIPSYKSEVSHTKNFSVQNDVLVSVVPALANRLSLDYLTDSMEDSQVLSVHPKSEVTRHLTLLQETRKVYVRAADLKQNSVNIDFFDLDSGTPAWQFTQISGSGGSVNFTGSVCEVIAGTGQGKVSQTFDNKKAGMIAGIWNLKVSQVSGQGRIRVLNGVTLLAESSILFGEIEHSINVSLSGSESSITVELVSASGTTSFVQLEIEEVTSLEKPSKELQRRFLVSSKRQSRVSLEFDYSNYLDLPLGNYVTLTTNRYGHSDGKVYMVVEKTSMMTYSTKKVTLWRVEQ